MEKEIKIAAKFYECRDTAKLFYKDKFYENIEPHTNIIKAVMKANQVDVLPSILIISKTNMYKDNGMTQMLFMAAAVEILEPSK